MSDVFLQFYLPISVVSFLLLAMEKGLNFNSLWGLNWGGQLDWIGLDQLRGFGDSYYVLPLFL